MSKNITTAFIIAIILLLGVGIYLAPKLYREYQKKVALGKNLDEGLDSFSSGDLQGAGEQFTQGAENAMTPDQRAQFEILLAATYEKSDFRRCADMYLKVMNNPEYSKEMRAYAASYLLLALSNTYNMDVAKEVFSVVPWEGYLNNRISDQRLNYETAITRGHEWALELSPNFLSYLLAGEFYARNYSSFPKEQQELLAPKLMDYYEKGSKAFATLAGNAGSHENVVANGYRTLGLYADELNILVKRGLIAPKESTISDAVVEGAYTSGENYMRALKDSPFKNTMLLTTVLYHGRFLLSLEVVDTARVATLGDSVAKLISSDRNSSYTVGLYGYATGGSFLELRKTLVSMGNLSPDLKDALLNKTGGFTAKDFVSQ